MSVPVHAPRFRAGEALPAVLTLRDLEDLFDLKPTRVWELYQAGELARFELLPRLGNRPRFSGIRLQAWLETGDQPAETPALRYFTKARRRG